MPATIASLAELKQLVDRISTLTGAWRGRVTQQKDACFLVALRAPLSEPMHDSFGCMTDIGWTYCGAEDPTDVIASLALFQMPRSPHDALT